MCASVLNPLDMLYVPCPDQDTASRLARLLVEAEVTGCCNIIPRIESIYRWQGAVHTEAEALLLIKTLPDKVEAATAMVRAHHPYQAPFIGRWPVAVAGTPFA